MHDVLQRVEAELRGVTASLDADLLRPDDASRLLDCFVRLGRLVDAGKLLLARRAVDSEDWRKTNAPTPAHELARRTGSSVREAHDVLATSRRLTSHAATEAAVRAGDLSADQAEAVSDAAAADPKCEADMLLRSAHDSLAGLGQARDRIKRAADPDPDARRQRIHDERFLRFGTDADGAGIGRWKVTPEVQAELKARLQSFIRNEFECARRENRREAPDAYAADALLAMTRAASGAPTGPAADRPADPPTDAAVDRPADPSAGEATADGAASPPARPLPRRSMPVKVIVRIDHEALLRGRTEPGEICEINGIGPVPVSSVLALIATGDVFLSAVVTRGTDVLSAVHFGRSPTALQLTALQWRDPCCRIEGCTRDVAEWDHHLDWRDTHQTTVRDLGGLCNHDHDLKTYGGYRLAPSPIPGKLRLLPPGDPDTASGDDCPPAGDSHRPPEIGPPPDG